MQIGEKRRFKTLLYEQFARVGKALANPHRLELLDVLAQGERAPLKPWPLKPACLLPMPPVAAGG
jgi:DNA-binding transcriptional ArsR family regulator